MEKSGRRRRNSSFKKASTRKKSFMLVLIIFILFLLLCFILNFKSNDRKALILDDEGIYRKNQKSNPAVKKKNTVIKKHYDETDRKYLNGLINIKEQGK